MFGRKKRALAFDRKMVSTNKSVSAFRGIRAGNRLCATSAGHPMDLLDVQVPSLARIHNHPRSIQLTQTIRARAGTNFDSGIFPFRSTFKLGPNGSGWFVSVGYDPTNHSFPPSLSHQPNNRPPRVQPFYTAPQSTQPSVGPLPSLPLPLSPPPIFLLPIQRLWKHRLRDDGGSGSHHRVRHLRHSIEFVFAVNFIANKYANHNCGIK